MFINTKLLLNKYVNRSFSNCIGDFNWITETIELWTSVNIQFIKLYRWVPKSNNKKQPKSFNLLMKLILNFN